MFPSSDLARRQVHLRFSVQLFPADLDHERTGINSTLIGLGMVAPPHLAALHALETVNLSGILERDATNTPHFTSHHGVPDVYDDVNALLADKLLTAIYCAARHGLRIGLPLFRKHPLYRGWQT